ncbi:MAG: PepSY-like domain-containing protein [Alistipes sp.]|jgi:hypothetical protein|nr:PepSY-like domain-containing protein [Alistipes sp.]
MRKVTLMVAALVATIFSVSADDRHINADQIPDAAKMFIAKYFGSQRITYATVDRGLLDNEYNVRLEDGTKIEFDDNGRWVEIDRKSAAVPMPIIPVALATYVQQSYPDAKILKIERDRNTTELTLQTPSHRVELKFDSQNRLIDIDD